MNLDDLKMGYFAVYLIDNSIFAKLIMEEQLRRGFSLMDAGYTHVDVLGGGPYAVRVSPPFTKVVDIRKVYPNLYVKIMRYKNEEYELKKRYKVAFWAASHSNLKYDWLGVIRFRLKFLWHGQGSWFCSENAAWALQKEYAQALGALYPEKAMPAHFLGKEFECVWEGEIK